MLEVGPLVLAVAASECPGWCRTWYCPGKAWCQNGEVPRACSGCELVTANYTAEIADRAVPTGNKFKEANDKYMEMIKYFMVSIVPAVFCCVAVLCCIAWLKCKHDQRMQRDQNARIIEALQRIDQWDPPEGESVVQGVLVPVVELTQEGCVVGVRPAGLFEPAIATSLGRPTGDLVTASPTTLPSTTASPSRSERLGPFGRMRSPRGRRDVDNDTPSRATRSSPRERDEEMIREAGLEQASITTSPSPLQVVNGRARLERARVARGASTSTSNSWPIPVQAPRARFKARGARAFSPRASSSGESSVDAGSSTATHCARALAALPLEVEPPCTEEAEQRQASRPQPPPVETCGGVVGVNVADAISLGFPQTTHRVFDS